ncbi:hypothetical protein [Sandarakinorhabdus limnophila]|uniref:hypothetical protein n=1 Tax=Sandarakinorhabdus limnophila TaxID=210512 RepID=UPI0037C52F8D
MEISSPASSERADACSNRCIRLMGVQSDEAEKIGLLAAILGWEIEPFQGVGRARSWIGGFPDAFGARDTLPWTTAAGDEMALVKGGSAKGVSISHICLQGSWAQGDPGRDPGADRLAGSPRLVLRQTDNVIRVDADDTALADQLARLGLDRLVLPVSLPPLEELLAFAE